MRPVKLLVELLLSITICSAAATIARGDELPRPTAALPAGHAPLSAVAVSQCGQAVALFIQLDATHMVRADPRQSDLFSVGTDGKMIQSHAGPMPWEKAYELALSAPISSHVTIPCTETPTL